MEWIKCNERLPQQGQSVLCYGNPTMCCELDMESLVICIARFENEYFHLEHPMVVINVEIWMPLPDIPV